MTNLSAPDVARPRMADRITGPLRGVLLESRQRWRDLVSLVADISFETDARGCFSFVAPDRALGWAAAELLGRPATSLLFDSTVAAGINPFSPAGKVQRQRLWLRRGDGGLACVLLSIAPLLDRQGRVIGTRGLATDITEQDERDAHRAAALRRGEVIEHILRRIREEVMAPRMMRVALRAMTDALGAEGAAVLEMPGEQLLVLHQAGEGTIEVLASLEQLLSEADPHGAARDGRAGDRPVMVSACPNRFGEIVGLALWRAAGERDWDPDDKQLAEAAVSIVRVVLEHEAIQREMANQARTDPLTGLLNRRAFFEELPRYIDRLEREQLPGTLMFADLDRLKEANDRFGHEIGDRLLRIAADALRETVRPTDLVARVGGDEFAVWLNGADHLTAAERVECLRVELPRRLAKEVPGIDPIGFSIGIANRRAGGGEGIESLMRRADVAMYEVKRSGRGHWRVSHEEAS